MKTKGDKKKECERVCNLLNVMRIGREGVGDKVIGGADSGKNASADNLDLLRMIMRYFTIYVR